jgi:hypothetical protein
MQRQNLVPITRYADPTALFAGLSIAIQGSKGTGMFFGSCPRFARLIDARSASGANGRPEIVTIGKLRSPSLVSVRPTSINALPNRFQFRFRQRLVDAFDPSGWAPQRPRRQQFRVPVTTASTCTRRVARRTAGALPPARVGMPRSLKDIFPSVATIQSVVDPTGNIKSLLSGHSDHP